MHGYLQYVYETCVWKYSTKYKSMWNHVVCYKFISENYSVISSKWHFQIHLQYPILGAMTIWFATTFVSKHFNIYIASKLSTKIHNSNETWELVNILWDYVTSKLKCSAKLPLITNIINLKYHLTYLFCWNTVVHTYSLLVQQFHKMYKFILTTIRSSDETSPTQYESKDQKESWVENTWLMSHGPWSHVRLFYFNTWGDTSYVKYSFFLVS